MKIRRELWFGFSLMAIIILTTLIFTPWGHLNNGHLGMLMLSLVVVAIMMGFPTAFTLMGMGVFFAWLNYRSVDPETATRHVLDLMVQRAYAVMSNDVLIAIPLFVFMGYLVERASLIDKLFKSLHLAMARVPGSLAVATIVTCAIFATATGIVGAVVTLMGLLAFPAMLRAGYSTKVAAGAITAGGCLGILIPPSVLLIVYGATAGVSVVQLYAGAFFPGLMLAGLYVGYIIVLAKLRPELMPPLAEADRRVALPPLAQALSSGGRNALAGLLRGLGSAGVARGRAAGQLLITLLPALAIAVLVALIYQSATAPLVVEDTSGLVQAGGAIAAEENKGTESAGLQEPKDEGTGLAEPKEEGAGLAEPKAEGTGLAEPKAGSGSLSEPKAAETVTAAAPAGTAEAGKAEAGKAEAGKAEAGKAEAGKTEPAKAAASKAEPGKTEASKAEPGVAAKAGPRLDMPNWFIGVAAGFAVFLIALYAYWTWERLEIFKMLLGSFFPLAVLILAVLGSIVFGLSTPTEAAAVGAFGGCLLAGAYRYIEYRRRPGAASGNPVWATTRELGSIIKDSSFLTAKTSAMVCWLFVGSSIFSAAFALLGGQELVEKWVLSLGLTPLQFMILAQFIIFILGWPLEWTEIIVIFMPIFIPLLPKFGVDPLFFGLLVALNLQTAFLSPPVAMAAFYLKGVAPPHVTLNQIFAGMMPFMGIQLVALVLLYVFPDIGLWLPRTLYK